DAVRAALEVARVTGALTVLEQDRAAGLVEPNDVGVSQLADRRALLNRQLPARNGQYRQRRRERVVGGGIRRQRADRQIAAGHGERGVEQINLLDHVIVRAADRDGQRGGGRAVYDRSV